MSRSFRVGLILPSSNTTMEVELAELLRRRQQADPDRFSLHSARMRMTQVTPDALAVMDRESGRCAAELATGMRHRRLRLPRRRDGRRQSRPHWCGKATLTSSLDGATHPRRDQRGRTRGGHLRHRGNPHRAYAHTCRH